MTTTTPLPIRRAIADDRLLDAARTRRQLTDTALVATGGGELRTLNEDATDRELWHARVRRPNHSGDVLVHLDRRLGTVVVQDDVAGGVSRAA